MASVCSNAASAQANYAGPMPIIGLYIAAATALCFLLILLDVLFAYLDKKPWIPVQFFSLNSFTLTVMGVATKLSVDLTTYMPGLDGQLSKLCSSVFICISMGFFMPSLGTMKRSERLANLTSLTIVVLTIIANVCMQISTGVIFSFVVEHIVILILMFILLWSCWSSGLEIDHVLKASVDFFKAHFKKSKLVDGKIDKLESCYQENYYNNPQVLMCEYSHCTTIGMLSSLCFTILLEAIIRATFLQEFQICMEYSDYKWSIWVVVAAQFLTCALGCLSITWRWISMAFHMEPNIEFSFKVRSSSFLDWKFNTIYSSDWDIYLMALKQLGSGALKCFIFLQSLVLFLRFGTQVLLNFIDELILFVIHIRRKPSAFQYSNDGFGSLRHCEYKMDLREWLLRKSEEDLKRWKEKNQSNHSQLSELFSSMLSSPSNDEIENNEVLNKCELLVFMLLSAKVVYTKERFANDTRLLDEFDSLIKAFDRVFEIICFVDEFLNSNSDIQRNSLQMAQDWWMTRDIDSGEFHEQIIKPAIKIFAANSGDQSQTSEVQRALDLFKEIIILASDFFTFEYKQIGEDILQNARLNTINGSGLYDVIKPYVLSIMHFYLRSFSTAIYRYIMDSPMDEIEARIKFAVKLSSKLEGLEKNINWQQLQRDEGDSYA